MRTLTPLEETPQTCCGIELTETVEDYLKAIFTIVAVDGSASTSGIAERLGVQAPTVTAMLHRLRSAELVQPAGWGKVRLTDHGHDHACGVVRRHRLLETFLHQVLGVTWDEVHEEAEHLEHHVSARLEILIDQALGHPSRDPHGDPIPRDAAVHDEHAETPLAEAGGGDAFCVQRVFDSDSEALRQLAELGIGPGARLVVEDLPCEAGAMWVLLGGRRCQLSADQVQLIQGAIGAAS